MHLVLGCLFTTTKTPIHLSLSMYRLQPNQLVDGCIHLASLLFLILFSTVIAAQDSVLLLKKLSSPDLSTRTLAMEKLKETELNTKDHDFIRKLFLTVDQDHMLKKKIVPEIQVQIEQIWLFYARLSPRMKFLTTREKCKRGRSCGSTLALHRSKPRCFRL